MHPCISKLRIVLFWERNALLCCMMAFTLLHKSTLSGDLIRCGNILNVCLFHNDGYNIEGPALKRMCRTLTESRPIHFMSIGSSDIYKRHTLGLNHSKWENADGIEGNTNAEDANSRLLLATNLFRLGVKWKQTNVCWNIYTWVHKRMLLFQKLTINLFLTIHG
jgi:hypothetical protein